MKGHGVHHNAGVGRWLLQYHSPNGIATDVHLREYEQHHKFAIAEVLRSAAALAERYRSKWQDSVRALFARLAEGRFNLVVVGRFNRGKSSLMNAVLGGEFLPVGLLPLTSMITTVSYRTKAQVVLTYDKRILTDEVPIRARSQYVTQQGNPGNVKKIKLAEVQRLLSSSANPRLPTPLTPFSTK